MKKEHMKTAGDLKSKKTRSRQSRGDKLLAAEQKKRDRQAIGMDFKGSRVYDNDIPPHWQPNIGHLGDRRMKGDSDSSRKKSVRVRPARENKQKLLPRGVTKTQIRGVKRHHPEMGRSAVLDFLSDSTYY